MVSAQNVIILTVLLVVISIAGIFVELAKPPDGGGRRSDSFGTRALGQRGMYELLDRLEVPISRILSPPIFKDDDHACLLMWMPSPDIVSLEPMYLRRARQWVEKGGVVIVAPPTHDQSILHSRIFSARQTLDTDNSVLAELGLSDELLTPEEEEDLDSSVADDFDNFLERDSLDRNLRRAGSRNVAARGELAFLSESVLRVHLPLEGTRWIVPTEGLPEAGALSTRDADGNERIFLASFVVGKGRIILVSEPEIFSNRLIAKSDNAVLVTRLLARLGRRVVIDEFYHGLTVRGNPLWLASRYPYGLFLLMLILASGFWIWRHAIALGPPLADQAHQRRTMAEYVDATARLFQRGRWQQFSLREMRRGWLWFLRKKLRLSPSGDDSKDIERVLRRKDPEAAERVRRAFEEIGRVHRDGAHTRSDDVVRACRRIAECL